MTRAGNAGVLWAVPLLIAVCFVSFPAEAETSRYKFLSEQSTLVQSGGIAGIHRTYTITGTFELTADFDAGTALFSQVDASAVCSIPSRSGKEYYSLDPNEVFSMTSLFGAVGDGGESIRFDGTADDGSSIQITLTLVDGNVSLKGETAPPLGSADFFIYTMDALAEPKYEYSGGTGEPNDPYQIATAEDLITLGESPEDYDKHFILTADIDLDPNLPGRKVFSRALIAPTTSDAVPWFEGTPFSSVFDGYGHTILHLNISGGGYLGLFGKLGLGAEVKNLGVLEVSIAGSGNCLGGLVGGNSGSIATSYSTGAVSGTGLVGGLAGDNSGSITTSSGTAKVSGEVRVGGLAGYNSGSITTSYSTGTVTGGWFSGGLVGDNVGWGELGVGIITASYSTGAVSGWTDVGGLVGRTQGGSIAASFWDMETSGQSSSADGTGLTTAEMQTASTFLEAGWDFVDETDNGTEDIWKISEGLDYPRLWWEKYSGGTGEADYPYQIATAEDLMLLGESPEDYDKYFILTADIDLDPDLPGRKVFYMAVIAPDTDTTKNAFQGTAFTGVFDGDGHTISHLTIRGKSYLGLFGELSYRAKISNLVLEAVDVSGTGDYVGGFVGRNEGSITTSFSTGRVSGERSVGGFVGMNFGSILTSYSTGAVSGETWVGGLVGENFGSIITSYSTSAVSGEERVGGLVGYNSGSISTSYSTGKVTGRRQDGGLVGENPIYYTPHGSITASFWDIETSGLSTSGGGTGLTTAEMKDINTYLNAGWDFIDEIRNGTCDYWQISPGDYPRLRYHTGQSPVMPEGLGTSEEPYLIRDARDLGAVWLEPSAHYRLEGSLDMSGITWLMAVVPGFEGTFDGNGYVISNLRIQGGGYLGLFGKLVPGAKISNLSLEAVDVNGTGDYVGGLAGINSCSITTSYSTGTVKGDSYVGGLAGYNSGSISTSSSAGAVSGDSNVGGLVGKSYGDITGSYSTVTVAGGGDVGGLVGSNSGSDISMAGGFMANCYSTGAVTGNSGVGGLVGYNSASITTSYSTGVVSGERRIGGLVADNLGIVATSFWDVERSGQTSSAGGTGLSTAEMMDPEMLGLNGLADNPNWVLDAYNDYPHLAWEGTTGDMIPQPEINWLDGDGTVESPYQIATADQLSRLSRAGVLTDRHFILVNDIDLAGLSWTQAVIPYFTGCFDGGGFILHHLHIQGTDDLGLIGYLGRDAIITNIGLKDVSIEGSDNVGGLVGRNNGGISNSYSTGTITGEENVGGLVGSNGLWGSDCGHVACCYNTGTVSGTDFVGGLVGFNYGNVSGCYSIGRVSGNYFPGGLVGCWTEIAIDCFWDIETSGQERSGGGVGLTTAEMQTAAPFLNAGWDFVGETDNGTEDIWWILEGQDYPRLWWELTTDEPLQDAGE